MYLFALFNSDSVKQYRNKYLTLHKYMANSTNVNITVKITLYIPVYSSYVILSTFLLENMSINNRQLKYHKCVNVTFILLS